MSRAPSMDCSDLISILKQFGAEHAAYSSRQRLVPPFECDALPHRRRSRHVLEAGMSRAKTFRRWFILERSSAFLGLKADRYVN